MVTSPVGCCFSVDGAQKLCWMIHTGCNLRCDHCAVFDNDFVAAQRGVRGQRDIERVMAFVSARRISKIVLSGGEPTLSKWCVPIIRRLAADGLEFSLSTNATTLTGRRVERLVQAGLRKATVSLDGAQAATHDRVRGEGSYDRALAGTAMLADAGVAVSVGMFLRDDSYDEVAGLGRICRELGVERLSLFYPVVRGRYAQRATAPPPVDPSALVRALRPVRLAGMRVTVHAPRCDEHDCPSGDTIWGAIGGQTFEHCVYKHRSGRRLALDMLAA